MPVPAAVCCVFALGFGEFELLSAGTDISVPYKQNRRCRPGGNYRVEDDRSLCFFFISGMGRIQQPPDTEAHAKDTEGPNLAAEDKQQCVSGYFVIMDIRCRQRFYQKSKRDDRQYPLQNEENQTCFFRAAPIDQCKKQDKYKRGLEGFSDTGFL